VSAMAISAVSGFMGFPAERKGRGSAKGRKSHFDR
jgi:hypothetical protein